MPIYSDPVTERTVGPVELARATGLLWQLSVVPFAVDQNTHDASFSQGFSRTL